MLAGTKLTDISDPHTKSNSNRPVSVTPLVVRPAPLGALSLWVLCCVSLSTAGSAVGPCGRAGRTVRRCSSAPSDSLSPHRTVDTEDRSALRLHQSHFNADQLSAASEPGSGPSPRG